MPEATLEGEGPPISFWRRRSWVKHVVDRFVDHLAQDPRGKVEDKVFDKVGGKIAGEDLGQE